MTKKELIDMLNNDNIYKDDATITLYNCRGELTTKLKITTIYGHGGPKLSILGAD